MDTVMGRVVQQKSILFPQHYPLRCQNSRQGIRLTFSAPSGARIYGHYDGVWWCCAASGTVDFPECLVFVNSECMRHGDHKRNVEGREHFLLVSLRICLGILTVHRSSLSYDTLTKHLRMAGCHFLRHLYCYQASSFFFFVSPWKPQKTGKVNARYPSVLTTSLALEKSLLSRLSRAIQRTGRFSLSPRQW